jgi:hypothetical protein
MFIAKFFRRTLCILIITVFIFVVFFYIFIQIVDQKKEEMIWAHNLYDKCVSSSEMDVAEIYFDINEVMQNTYNVEKLKKYKIVRGHP